jgi:hypothetical protein
MMATLIIVLFALAFLHFIYEGIVAPSVRMTLRYRLYALRDEIRALKAVHGDDVPDELYCHMESSLNGTIKHLHQIDAGLAYRAWNAMDGDEELRARVERLEVLFSECRAEVTRRIREQHREKILYALLLNLGAWGLYLTPVVLVAIAYSGIASTVKKVLLLPEGDLDKIAPTDRFAST